jgi:hypothetical protein
MRLSVAARVWRHRVWLSVAAPDAVECGGTSVATPCMVECGGTSVAAPCTVECGGTSVAAPDAVVQTATLDSFAQRV